MGVSHYACTCRRVFYSCMSHGRIPYPIRSWRVLYFSVLNYAHILAAVLKNTGKHR
jgi:hypothetical protein